MSHHKTTGRQKTKYVLSKRSRIILTHVAAWIIYWSYEYVVIGLIGYLKVNFVESLLAFFLYIPLFYSFTLILFPKFLERKRYVKFSVYSAFVIGLFIWLRYEVKVHIAPFLSSKELMYPYEEMRLFIADAIYRGGYFIIIASFYWFATKSIKQERERRRLEQQKRKDEQQLRILETNLKDAEIAYLKNQINPHFLFNTLNFFYDQIYPHSKQVAQGVLLLSKIMRYALRKSDTHKVMLPDDIEHLEDYIAINQLRFSNQLQVEYEVVGDPSFRMIIPLVLITFVENCFKYGDLLDPSHPVHIKITITDQQLLFYTHNKKKAGPIEQSTGIGIENTRRRLDVVYKNNYSLHIKNASEFYTTELIINL